MKRGSELHHFPHVVPDGPVRGQTAGAVLWGYYQAKREYLSGD